MLFDCGGFGGNRQKAGDRRDAAHLVDLGHQGSNGIEAARELLNDELKPTAVFAISDHYASFVHLAGTHMGLRIPQERSLVGFADLDFAATMDPPLTTMRQKPYELGRRAAKLIMDRTYHDQGQRRHGRSFLRRRPRKGKAIVHRDFSAPSRHLCTAQVCNKLCRLSRS